VTKRPRGLTIGKLSSILGCIIAVATIVGLLWSLDQRWAKSAEVKQLELRLDQKIMSDRVGQIQERMWKLEDRYKSVDKMPEEVKYEYRALQVEKELLGKRLTESLKEGGK